MLYRELTSIDKTIGMAMDKISGNTGFSFIKVSFIIIDSFFVAQNSEEAMTALSLVYPVQNFINVKENAITE